MLTSVANYLFGSGEAEPVKEEDVVLETKPAPEQEWVLVDMQTNDMSPTTQQAELRETHSTLHGPCTSYHVSQNLYTISDSESDSAQSQPSHTPSTPGSLSPVAHSRHCRRAKVRGCHESWILTPPPCFTAGGTSSSQVEMSPMENLLIEHPSMSVYHSNCSRGSTGEESDLSDTSLNNFSQVIKKRGLRPRNSRGVVVTQPPRRPQAVAARAGLLAEIDSISASQRANQYKASRRLTRNSLNRLNKATECTGRGNYSRRNPIQCPRNCTAKTYQMKH